MRKFDTLTNFLNSTTSDASLDPIVEFEGYSVKGIGGAQWKFTGLTGQTPSQSPADLVDALLNDASGNQWAIVGTPTMESVGAVGDLVNDDRIYLNVLSVWFINNSSNNVTLEFKGTYLIDSFVDANNCALFKADKSLTIKNTGLIKAGVNILQGPSQRRMFRFETITNDASNRFTFTWEGGEVNMELADPNALPGVDAVSIGPKYYSVNILDSMFNHGTSTATIGNVGSGGGDSSLFIKEAIHVVVSGCTFIGPQDLGIYLSGDDSVSRDGENARITDNNFYRCGHAISSKRKFLKTIIKGNTVFECGGLFFNGGTGSDDGGLKYIITGNDVRKSRANPIDLKFSDDAIVCDNILIDYRKEIADDGATETSVSTGNYGGGVSLSGITNSLVSNNIIGFEEWTAPATALKQAYGIALKVYTDIGAGDHNSSNNIINSNIITATHGTIIATADTNDNLFGSENKSISTTINGFDVGTDNRGIIDQEGTWTPTLFDQNANTAVDVSSNGRFSINRNRVSFEGFLNVDASSLTGVLRLGIPTTVLSTGPTQNFLVNTTVVTGVTYPANKVDLVGRMANGATFIQLNFYGDAQVNVAVGDLVTTNVQIMLSGQYTI